MPRREGRRERRRMGDGEGEHRVAEDLVHLDRLVDREQPAQPGGSHPREQAAHHGDQDEGPVEVDALTECPTRLHERELLGSIRGPEHRERNDSRLRRHPHEEKRPRLPSPLGKGPRPRRAAACPLVEQSEQVLVRDDPGGFAARHAVKEVGAAPHHGLQLVEADAAVAIRVGHREEDLDELLGRLRGTLGHLALAEGHRDHAQDVLAVEGTVAVVIVHAKREGELLAIGPEDELAHALEKLGLVDRAVAVAVERGEHASGQVGAAQAERFAQLLGVDPRVGTRVMRESFLEHRH